MPTQQADAKSQEEQLLMVVREIISHTDNIHDIATKIVKTIVTPTPKTELTKMYHALSRPNDGIDMRIDIVVNTAVALEDWHQGDEAARANMPSKTKLLYNLFNALGTDLD